VFPDNIAENGTELLQHLTIRKHFALCHINRLLEEERTSDQSKEAIVASIFIQCVDETGL
jgi:hypothetical protein